jgi:uncharacterized repeat protein (TIGR03803 family)
MPSELTAGKNVLKILGNTNVFKQGSPILVEVLDSRRNTIYVEFPNYFDSLKRRLIVINITEDTAPGPALITICSVLNENLVPLEFNNTFNFKWQAIINVAPFKSNTTEIVYIDPPTVELRTRVRPYVTTSFRNNEQMITKEYGDYEYLDFNFDDYVGSNDGASSIFQTQDANTVLNSFTNASITSFDRDNVFYLKPENYSAKTINRNYPIIEPSKDFYVSLGSNIIGNYNSFGTWDQSGNTIGTDANRGNILIRGIAGSYVGRPVNTMPGNYYLVAVDVSQSLSTSYDISAALGYNESRNSGSISENVRVSINENASTNTWETCYAVVRASDAGNYLWLFFGGTAGSIDNVRVFPINGIGTPDFKLETDLIGGLIKVNRPNISPQTASGLTLYNTDTAYRSYINFLLRDKNAAANGAFTYNLVKESELSNPTTFTINRHKIERFTSRAQISQTNLNNTFVDSYVQAASFVDPYGASVLLTIVEGPNNTFYGPIFAGGAGNGGGIFSYNTDTNVLNTEHYFNTSKFSGKEPSTKFLYLKGGSNPGMYGTTNFGGRFNSGSLFRFDPQSKIVTKLHDFGLTSGSSTFTTNSGWFPYGSLMQASNGLLYGTTANPSPGGPYGTVYSFNTSSNEHKVFLLNGGVDAARLIESGGFLFGVKGYQTAQGDIVKINLSTGTTSSFALNVTQGKIPSGLIMGSDGYLYATTFTGSASSGTGGTILKVDSGTGVITKLFDLDTVLSGSEAERELYEDSGHFYGMCNAGGQFSKGTVFRFTTGSGGTFEVLHHFSGGSDGIGAKSNFIRLGNSLYANTTNGGTSNAGTIFRLDRIGLNRPFVFQEAGTIYHHNAILPKPIPATSSLLIDYPRWTGPVKLNENDLYSIVELEIKDLDPVTGDVSKLKLSAKPQGLKGEFVDLGVYSTKPVDILIDNNFVNHVHYSDSPYRLAGYFKPVISSFSDSSLEKNSFKQLSFATGWATASVTESNYFKGNQTFAPSMSIKDAPELNLNRGACFRIELQNTPTENMLGCIIYTASAIPPGLTNLNLWEQFSYNLYSAAPFPIGMDITASDWYTSSLGYNINKFNSILVYSGLVTKTGSILAPEDIYAISDKISNAWAISGSGNTASIAIGHPLTFNNKLGWITDTYFITSSVASTQPLYPAIFFEYNTIHDSIFSSSISTTRPHIVEVSNVSCREIGDRDYMIDTYWDSEIGNYGYNTQIAGVPYTPSNTDKLADSVKLTVYDGVTGITSSLGSAYKNKNAVLFKTADSYKFYKNVPYIISFNAFSQINEIRGVDPAPVVSNLGFPFVGAPGWGNNGSGWTENTGQKWKAYNFGSSTSGYIRLNDIDFFANTRYQVKVTTGAFTYLPEYNITTLSVISGSVTSSISNIRPNTTYTFYYTHGTTDTTGPKIQLDSTFTDSNHTIYLTGVDIRRYDYDFKSNTNLSSVLPSSSKLKVYGINTNFGVPFADQLTTADPGEFIGELEQTLTYGQSGETKYFGRVEMEFAPETEGFGNIGFETDLGAEWYISDISIRPKDRVGLTPASTRLFIKIPNDLVNKKLTFKIEYLNDSNSKAVYNTLLNDVMFSNKDESISGIKGVLDSSMNSVTEDDTTSTGPNSDPPTT